jgi:hypothetical protein
MADERIPSEFLMEYWVELSTSSYAIGVTPEGHRLTGGIAGGGFEGPRLRGRLEPFGADFAILRPDGALAPVVKGVLRTDDDALIFLQYEGILHPWDRLSGAMRRNEAVEPGSFTWNVVMRFETSAPKYEWLNRVTAVAIGEPRPGGPRYDVWAVGRLPTPTA